MIQELTISAEKEKPGVYFNKQENIFSFTGKSLLYDPKEFFAPIHEWFAKYCLSPNPETTISISLDYLNSASIRAFIEFLITLEELSKKGFKVKVQWKHRDGDEIIKERGEEIEEVLNIPFEYCTI